MSAYNLNSATGRRGISVTGFPALLLALPMVAIFLVTVTLALAVAFLPVIAVGLIIAFFVTGNAGLGIAGFILLAVALLAWRVKVSK